MIPPRLETPRLVLRELQAADFPAFAATQADADVMRYMGKPLGREEAWRKFAMMSGFWALLGYGWWTVLDRQTGSYVGYAGVCDFNRGIEGFHAPHECGWTLAAGMSGKGYATEAARAVLDWTAARFPRARFTCLINKANSASVRVAEKCGFKRFGEGTYHDAPVLFFERAR